MAEYDVDLFVIGAGSGGVRAARIAASYGASVMLAEEFRVGGTCVIRGCVPKKLMVYASRYADEFVDAAGFGWHVPETSFDWTRLVNGKEKEITRLSGIYRSNLDKAGVTLIENRAVVEDAHRVRIVGEDRTITARTILIATGGHPVLMPPVPGIEHTITSNEIFDLPQMPKRILIVGGGYIAVEFGALLARLGSQVTLAVRASNILRGFDEELRTALRDAMVEAGINFKFGILPERIDKAGATLKVTLNNGATLEVDQVMLATGRNPNTKDLGLEKAGVSLDAIGAVKVDEFSQSTVPSIYAVGDVTNRIALTPVAIREGHAFADTVFGNKPTAVDYIGVPTAVFTTPELGTVGLTETEAREAYHCVDIYSTKFRPLKATVSGRAEKTLMKLVVDGETDKVLGAHVLGEAAGEMVQLLGIAIKMGAKKADFDATMAVHPTSAEEFVTLRTRTARYRKDKADMA
ncbi:MAG: glutathione-disulfide reductase [Beijerinckiaceae bacterium]|nr:MAG: glutathione-disulfide reductase [Beijerinckiaceae bacterium]